MSMPKMTGKNLALKMIDVRPDLPVILLSGFCEEMNPLKVKELGIYRYMMKPVGMKELSLAIRDALSPEK